MPVPLHLEELLVESPRAGDGDCFRLQRTRMVMRTDRDATVVAQRSGGRV